jgi:hypothetical protein
MLSVIHDLQNLLDSVEFSVFCNITNTNQHGILKTYMSTEVLTFAYFGNDILTVILIEKLTKTKRHHFISTSECSKWWCYDESAQLVWNWRMPPSGMWRRVACVRTCDWEERIRGVLQLLLLTYLARWFLSPWWWRRYIFSETSVLTRTTRRYVTEDCIHSS